MSDPRCCRILYMEDDEALGRLLQKSLLRLGYRVDVARNGAEGMDLMGKAAYDLVLVDYNMPCCDGLDVLRRMGGREKCPPVIMVTGNGNEKIAAEALKLGAGDYVVKDPEMGYLQLLPHVIDQVLHKQQLLQERRQIDLALGESEERYRTLVELSPDGVVVHRNGCIEFINCAGAALLGGGSARELVGRPLLDFVRHDFRKKWTHHLRQVQTGGKAPRWSEVIVVRPEHDELFAEVASVPLELDGSPAVQSLFRNISERKRTEKEIRLLNAELELRVSQRTAQLEASTKELEGFCFAVSHDLRAPLIRLDGFSRALMEDCGEHLNFHGNLYAERIANASRELLQLVDALLDMSRLTRSAMTVSRVNLSGIASCIAEELRQDEPARRVEFSIVPEVVVIGDACLLQVVMENLMRNSWKFTGKAEQACIEFGVTQRDTPVYYVRDNGAGFDMNYADKLFKPFQRLHSQCDFNGTGIGLATVQRIIQRHGGRIWAEGAVGKGASFYFSLGNGCPQLP